jgi:hypothetical protein
VSRAGSTVMETSTTSVAFRSESWRSASFAVMRGHGPAQDVKKKSAIHTLPRRSSSPTDLPLRSTSRNGGSSAITGSSASSRPRWRTRTAQRTE